MTTLALHYNYMKLNIA